MAQFDDEHEGSLVEWLYDTYAAIGNTCEGVNLVNQTVDQATGEHVGNDGDKTPLIVRLDKVENGEVSFEVVLHGDEKETITMLMVESKPEHIAEEVREHLQERKLEV